MACQIITSCVLLGQASFLQHHGSAVVRSLQALIGTAIPTAFQCNHEVSNCAGPSGHNQGAIYRTQQTLGNRYKQLQIKGWLGSNDEAR